MQVSVSGKQVVVDEALRESASERLASSVNKFFDRALEGQVNFSRDGMNHRVDISVHAGSGITVQSHAASDDMRGAFDMALDRIEKRLRRYKRRLIDHHQARLAAAEQAANEMEGRQYVLAAEPVEEEEEQNDTDAEEGSEPVIIAESTLTIPTLTVSEAVMRMELAELPVLLFRNSRNDDLNVVYRRPDGNVGWIETNNLGR